jgi:hypothetical protein
MRRTTVEQGTGTPVVVPGELDREVQKWLGRRVSKTRSDTHIRAAITLFQ